MALGCMGVMVGAMASRCHHGVIDITASVTTSGFNDLSYFGFFNGMDPDPKSNPGIMIFSSYMTYYKEL